MSVLPITSFLVPLIDHDFDDCDYDIGTEMHPDAYGQHDNAFAGYRPVVERNRTWLFSASYGEKHNLNYDPLPVRPKNSLAERSIDYFLRRRYERDCSIYQKKLNLKRADDDWVAQGFVMKDSEWLNLAYEIAFLPHVRDDVARMTAHNWLTFGEGQSKEEGITKDHWIWNRSLELSRETRGIFS